MRRKHTGNKLDKAPCLSSAPIYIYYSGVPRESGNESEDADMYTHTHTQVIKPQRRKKRLGVNASDEAPPKYSQHPERVILKDLSS